MRYTGRVVLWAVLFATAVGVVAGVVATRHGTGLNPDSAGYLGAASNIVDRRSISVPFDNDIFTYPPAVAARFDGKVPLTQWPPAYPVALAVGTELGLGAMRTARAIDVFAFAATAGLAAAIVYRIRRRPLLAALTGAVVALAPATAGTYSLVLSDPIFIAMELAVLLTLLLYVERQTRARLVVVCSGIALASLTRFVGVALIPVGVVTIAWFTSAPARDRWRRAALVAASGIVPLAAWSLVTRHQGGSAVRTIGHYNVRRRDVLGAMRIVGGWFVPFHTSSWVLYAVAVVSPLVIVGAYVLLRARRGRGWHETPDASEVALALLLTFVVSYALVLFFTRLFVDANTLFDSRYLLPMLAPMVVLAVIAASAVPAVSSRPRVAWVSIPLIAALFLMVAWPPKVHDGFREPTFPYPVGPPRSGVFAAARRLPKGALIISNLPGSVWLAAHRPAILVPVRTSLITKRRNPDFDRDMAEVGALMRTRCTFVIDGGTYLQGQRLATVDDLRARLDLREVQRFGAGSIWQLAGGAPCSSGRAFRSARSALGSA